MPKPSKKIEEHISDEEIEVEEVEEVEEENDVEDSKTKGKKLKEDEIFDLVISSFNDIITGEAAFVEKEKTFLQTQKEFQTQRKKQIRTFETYMKRFEKIYRASIDKQKSKKPRNTENAGKGGFNKKARVPEILRKFLGLESDDEYSRPEITNLLNTKFKEIGIFKVRKETNESGKERDIKIIVLDRSTAKKLGRTTDEEIRSKDIQTFIKTFYTNESQAVDA
jgi:hypothetical protein